MKLKTCKKYAVENVHKYVKICNRKYASNMQVYAEICRTIYAIICIFMHIHEYSYIYARPRAAICIIC